MRQNTITANEMKAIDKNAVSFGMSALQLMENAGFSVADKVLDLSNSSEPFVLFVAGLGNNGGDTFVAARHLADQNISSAVILLGREYQIKTQESKTNFSLLKHSDYISVFETQSESEFKELFGVLSKKAEIWVDGIFGTGFSGCAKGIEKTAIDLMNAEKKTNLILSVDIPSGMPPAVFSSPDSKNVSGSILKADVTVTFHKMKTFLDSDFAQKYAGDVFVYPIGIPEFAEKYIGKGDLSLLSPRLLKSHKGNNGKVLIIAGGPYTGAPALAGMGALRVGCDIVTIAAPKSIFKEVAVFAPEFIVRKLSENLLSETDVSFLSDLIAAHDCVVIGPGLGQDSDSLLAASKLIPYCKKAIIDADALSPVVLEAILKRKTGIEVIITPHYHELIRISNYLGMMLPKKERLSSEELETILLKISQKLNAVVLLKGEEDMIAFEGEIRYNLTGNAGMTVGGTGDVLAGVAGGLFAVNGAVLSAGCGAYICGKAGDLAGLKKGFSLIPTDILKEIPSVLFDLMEPTGQKNSKKKNKKCKNENKNKNKKRDCR